MTFSARQVLTAAQLNDLSINTLTTTGIVTIGGNTSSPRRRGHRVRPQSFLTRRCRDV